MLNVFVALVCQTAFAKITVGTQALIQTPNGKLTRCAGNLFYPRTVCVGTDNNDTIIDPVEGGTIFGFKGDDKFQGLLGSETVFGNDGNDTIQGGNGSSTLFGNNGNDVLVGGGGPNFLYGGGTNFLFGGNGNDQLIGGLDHEVMIGGPGHDVFVCKGKPDLIVDFKPGIDKKEGNCVLF
jgi:Ca2+-binding RTX toxin-like protein